MPIITSKEQIMQYDKTFQNIFKTFVPDTYNKY